MSCSDLTIRQGPWAVVAVMATRVTWHIDWLVQERHNSIANALELRLSCTNPSISIVMYFLDWAPRAANHYWISVNEALSRQIFLNFGSKYWNFLLFCHNYHMKILKLWEMLLKVLKLYSELPNTSGGIYTSVGRWHIVRKFIMCRPGPLFENQYKCRVKKKMYRVIFFTQTGSCNATYMYNFSNFLQNLKHIYCQD